MAVSDRIAEATRELMLPYKNYHIYLHLIYKPIEKAKFLTGVESLRKFLRIAKERGFEQKRRDHPIAFELILTLPRKNKLTLAEEMRFLKAMREILIDAFFSPELLNYAEIGYDIKYSAKPVGFKAFIRYSRDGEKFYRIDVTRVAKRLLGDLIEE